MLTALRLQPVYSITTQDVILCPIDLSEHSKDTLKWAAGFSQLLGCSLTVLYTYRLTHHLETDAVGWKRRIEKDAADKFSVLEQECLKGSGVDYSFKAEVGFTANRIEDFLRNNEIRFLIVSKSILTDQDGGEDLIKRIAVPTVMLP